MHSPLAVIWFLVPAGVANMAPVVPKRLPVFTRPIDFGLEFRGKPLFGPNKTWRGLIFGILMAILTLFIQRKLAVHTTSLNLIDYARYNFVWLGFLQGVGALGGDLVKSFAKRQLNKTSGKSWVPFDQIDWIVGSLILTWPLVHYSFGQVVAALVVLSLSHPLANLVGYSLRLKPNKF